MRTDENSTKVGRNALCPCESGKKFKRCCLNKDANTTNKNIEKNISLSSMGLPNQIQHIISVASYRDKSDPRNRHRPGGEPGQYNVAFLFSKPNYRVIDEKTISGFEQIDGNSHLAITKPAYIPPNDEDATNIIIRAQNDEGEIFKFLGIPNKRGFLSKVCSDPFSANNLNDAYNKAHKMLMPSLSHWSASLDIPLFVECVQVNEIASGQHLVTWTSPFFETPFAVMPEANLTPEFRCYLSLYREALVSNSPVYQFLCFFKIIESIIERRDRLTKNAKDRGEKLQQPKERMPANAKEGIIWLNAIYYLRPPKWDIMSLQSIFREKLFNVKFNKIINDRLRPLRNNIAHAFFSEKGELAVYIDDISTINEVHNWLPLTKCLVRHMLKNAFPEEFLPNLDAVGKFVK